MPLWLNEGRSEIKEPRRTVATKKVGNLAQACLTTLAQYVVTVTVNTEQEEKC
jgi:hypothetical protein